MGGFLLTAFEGVDRRPHDKVGCFICKFLTCPETARAGGVVVIGRMPFPEISSANAADAANSVLNVDNSARVFILPKL